LYDLELRESVEAELEEGSNDGRPCGTEGNASKRDESSRPEGVDVVERVDDVDDSVGDDGRSRRGAERERDWSVDFLELEMETVLERGGLR